MIQLKSRHQVLSWKNTTVDKELVNDLVTKALTRMPSKQDLRRCNATLIDMSIGNRSNLIYRTTLHSSPEGDAGFNPQVLAPWILSLGVREAAWDENDASHDWFLREASLEMGLIAGYVTLLAPDMGLGTSFCACINDKFGLSRILGCSPELFIGIGIENTESTQFYCPVRNNFYDVANDGTGNNPHPKISLDTFYTVI